MILPIIQARRRLYVIEQILPTLSFPTDTTTGGTTADLSVTTDISTGTLYWVVTTSSTAPTKTQVKAGLDHTGAAASDSGSQAVLAVGVQNAEATGLTGETAYFAHFMHEDAEGGQSDVVSGDGFTTDAETLVVSFIASAVGNASAVCPTVEAGDLLVFFELGRNGGGSDPGYTVPTGFTGLVSSYASGCRVSMSYKIADGTEDGTAFNSMSASTDNGHVLLAFRGTSPIASVTGADGAAQATFNNPAAQVVNASGGAVPLIVLGAGFYSALATTLSFSPAADALFDSGVDNLYAGYKIYNSSPADVTVDIGDGGNFNNLISCYIQLA